MVSKNECKKITEIRFDIKFIASWIKASCLNLKGEYNTFWSKILERRSQDQIVWYFHMIVNILCLCKAKEEAAKTATWIHVKKDSDKQIVKQCCHCWLSSSLNRSQKHKQTKCKIISVKYRSKHEQHTANKTNATGKKENIHIVNGEEREREREIILSITTNSNNNNIFRRTHKQHSFSHSLAVFVSFTETLIACERALAHSIAYDVVFDNYCFLFMFYRSVDEHVTVIVYRLTEKKVTVSLFSWTQRFRNSAHFFETIQFKFKFFISFGLFNNFNCKFNYAKIFKTHAIRK